MRAPSLASQPVVMGVVRRSFPQKRSIDGRSNRHSLFKLSGQINLLRLSYVCTAQGASFAFCSTSRAGHHVGAGQKGRVYLAVHANPANHRVQYPRQSFVGVLQQ